MDPATAMAFLLVAIAISASVATVVEMHTGGGDK